LIHRRYHGLVATLHVSIFKRQHLKSRKLQGQKKLYRPPPLEWKVDNFRRNSRMSGRFRFDF
jgi:hypothetical protein